MSKDLERIIATMKEHAVELDGKNDYRTIDEFIRKYEKLALTNSQVWKVMNEYVKSAYGTADF